MEGLDSLVVDGGPLFIIRAWVVVEMAGEREVQGMRGPGEALPGVGSQEVACGRVVSCEALSTEAWYVGRRWRPEVALRQREEEEEEQKAASESDPSGEEPGCCGQTPHL